MRPGATRLCARDTSTKSSRTSRHPKLKPTAAPERSFLAVHGISPGRSVRELLGEPDKNTFRSPDATEPRRQDDSASDAERDPKTP